jgi:predicted nucleotidyltransferase
MTTRMEITREVVKRCKKALESHYGPQLRGLILYGSAARNQADSMSDIDLLVLLSQPFDYFSELRQVIDMLYPIQMESEQLISARPVPLDEFECGSIQLYRNAKRDGVLV